MYPRLFDRRRLVDSGHRLGWNTSSICSAASSSPPPIYSDCSWRLERGYAREA